MKTWKRLLALLCVLVCLCGMLPAAGAVDGTVYVRKHVSLLYDDSGSMNQKAGNLKWCYASYAAQTFAGLLNETDTLTLTFMEVGEQPIPIDLTADRQQAVNDVMEYTGGADNDTPIGQIDAALAALDLSDAQGQNDQYWLVLTTDGVFYEGGKKCTEDRLVKKIVSILGANPELKVVYFGIGTENDSSDQKAIDLKDNAVLKEYSNFSAEYAQNHTEIVSTMRALANRIAGRYDVDDTVAFSGNTVTLDISGETSPIRNISVFAQNTNAKLIKAVASDGKDLSVERSASIQYPHKDGYTNIAAGTLGGYTALIETKNGEKIPPGTVELTFSEAVNEQDISLMYEPAIYIDLQVERKDADGQWVATGASDKLYEGDELRVDYAICEDGTGVELDAGKLFGKTEEHITYNGSAVKKGEIFTAVEGTGRLNIDLSLMDGAYCLSSGKTLVISKPGLSDYEVRASGPVTMSRKEAAENVEAYVQFEVFLRGAPADKERMKAFDLTVEGPDGQKLSGKTDAPDSHILRFTPKDRNCAAAVYTVTLRYDDTAAASQTITVEPNPTTYSAVAEGGITIMSNHIADNDSVVTFAVTAHTDDGDRPITAEEAALFRVQTTNDAGEALDGKTAFAGEGKITFMPQDVDASVGDYTAQLKLDDEVLAEAPVAILLHNMVYSIKTAVREANTVEWFKLRKNENHVAFVIYGDGEPCTAAQVQAMLDSGDLIVNHTPGNWFLKLTVTQGLLDGDAALICTPDGTGGFVRALLRCIQAVIMRPLETIDISLKVDMVHGAEAMEQMTVTYSGRRDWLIALIILLIVAGLLGWQLVVNALSAKLKRGTLYYIRVRKGEDREDKNLYHTKKRYSTGIMARFGILPRPETVATEGDVVFYAEADGARRKRSGRVAPSYTIHKSKEALMNYRWSYQPTDERVILLQELCGKRRNGRVAGIVRRNGNQIDLTAQLEGLWKSASIMSTEQKHSDIGQREGCAIAKGDFDTSYSYIVSFELKDDVPYYHIWTYIDSAQQKEERKQKNDDRRTRR